MAAKKVHVLKDVQFWRLKIEGGRLKVDDGILNRNLIFAAKTTSKLAS